MKRALSLLSLMLLFVAQGWAQTLDDLSGATWYTIQNNSTSGPYVSVASGYKDDAGNLKLANTTEDTGFTGLWTLVGNDADGYRFYNRSLGNTQVLAMTGSEGSGRAKMVDATSVPTGYSDRFDRVSNGAGFSIKVHGTANNYWNKRGDYLAFWNDAAGSTDNGSRFIFHDVTVNWPVMSTVDDPVWYKINFTQGNSYLQSMGDNALMQTAGGQNTSSQFFCLIGTRDNMKMYSRNGYYIGVKNAQALNGQTSNLLYSTTEANAVALCIQESPSQTGKFVISQTTDKTKGFNTWGGAGAGRSIGFWSTSDNNDQLVFVAESDIPVTEYYAVTPGSRPTDISKYSLWYDVPAAYTGVSDTWMEYALPLGNGQLGATFRGNILKDELQLNEKTLWSGYTTNGSSNGQGYFQNMGSILVSDLSGAFSTRDESLPVRDYQRYLDIMDGVGGVNYKSADRQTHYRRRYFTSAPDRVMVARYEAEGTDRLSLCFAFVPDAVVGSTVTYTATGASFGKKLQTITYHTAFEVESDGHVVQTAEGIKVTGATWAHVIQAAATDYDATRSGCTSGETMDDLQTKVRQRITAAMAKGYDALLTDNVADYHRLMGRVDLNIGGSSDRTTEDLIKYYNASAANKTTADGLFLETLYFQYGRYMTIAANNDPTIHAPSNLQGIWNDRSNTPFWHCDIHADINVEMNYWPADPTNLSEMHLPFVNHIIDLASAPSSPWKALANKLGNTAANGWTVACENNIFGGTSTWENGRMKTLGSWYVSHLWRYYQYSRDRDFLKRALPVMMANCQYTMSIAKSDTTSNKRAGTLPMVILGEWSPEHGLRGPNAFAQQTASEAIANTLAAHEVLGAESPVNQTDIDNLKDFFATFDKGIHIENYSWSRGGTQYTDRPCISEWLHSPLTDPTHRHLSHLMCVYPFAQISAYDTSDEGEARFEAAKNGILARNGDVTGWSMGWQTNVYARLLQGDNARSYLSQALRHSTSYVIAMGGQGGCYYNLFDAHSPFQIDGNYGCTSGIAEMLLQSYDDVITLLPALPTAWNKGHVHGLKAQGNFTVDIEWDCTGARHIVEARITSGSGAPLSIRGLAQPGDEVKVFDAQGCQVQSSVEGGIFTTPTQVGDIYTIHFNVASIQEVVRMVSAASPLAEITAQADVVLKK